MLWWERKPDWKVAKAQLASRKLFNCIKTFFTKFYLERKGWRWVWNCLGLKSLNYFTSGGVSPGQFKVLIGKKTVSKEQLPIARMSSDIELKKLWEMLCDISICLPPCPHGSFFHSKLKIQIQIKFKGHMIWTVKCVACLSMICYMYIFSLALNWTFILAMPHALSDRKHLTMILKDLENGTGHSL